MTRKKALEIMEKVRRADNCEYVGRLYRYHVAPCYVGGLYIGEELTRCNMNGTNSESLYIDVAEDF